MKLNEIRLGNLFYPIDKSKEIHLPVNIPFKVWSVGPTSVKAYESTKEPTQLLNSDLVDFRSDEIAGIPITEEILLKYGFVKSANFKFIHPLDDSYTIIKGEGFYVSNVLYEVKYIHQLQNIHFALTGKELE